MPAITPPSQKMGQGGDVPGSLNVRPAPAMAMKKLVRLMGQGYKMFGEELMKEQPDPSNLARAKAMISQAAQAAKGMQGGAQSGAQDLRPSYGRPRPVDGQVDPMTLHPAGMGHSRNES
jgi:hypothetical protein